MALMKRSYRKFTSIVAFLICSTVMALPANAQKPFSKKYNVLFIMVDDLKPELGCYGSAVVKSPNIDELAKSSTTFTAAYCQQAVCGPTRTSLLTGLRPDKTKVWDLKTKFRDENPEIVSLPQYFKANGYFTMGMGKVFDLSNTDKEGDAVSWSVPHQKTFPLAKGYENIAYGIYQSEKIKAIVRDEGNEGREEQEFYGPNKNPAIRYSTECLDVPDNAYMDGAMADYAIRQLKELKNKKQPFFMAVGFKKPHLPFIAPQKYWDLYDRNKIDLAAFTQKAAGSPDFAYHNAGELRNYAADIKSLDEKSQLLLLPEEKQRELIHGYYACISYTDAQIGKLLAALKANGLDKNTIVVLLGDHGWHLGDHSLWCKHSNFEQAVHVPLMFKMPGITNGSKSNSMVEFTDIYPTLCELTGLKTGKHLDGKSLKPVLQNKNAVVHDYAISQYPRGFNNDPRGIMGYSLRNKQYRYTEWIGGSFTTAQLFDVSKVKAVELYDYVNDPLETKNLAAEPGMEKVAKEMSEKLHEYYAQQFRTAGVVN